MPTKPLRVGVARCDLTPELGEQLAGYAGQHRPAQAIADPLHATVLVLAQGDEKAAIISLDWILVEEEDVETIRRDVHQRTGIAPENVTVCATHTHTAPKTMSCWGFGAKSTPYVNAMLPRIVNATVEAAAKLQTVRLGIGVVESDIGVNRREILEDGSVTFGENPWGAVDSTMTVARFENNSGPVATIVHNGAHPTAAGMEPIISRDWPGVLCNQLESKTSAPVLFLPGASGDVAPRVSDSGLAAVEEVGQRAAVAAWNAWQAEDFHETPDLKTHTAAIDLPFAPLPSPEEAQLELENVRDLRDAQDEKVGMYHYWEAVLQAHDQPPREVHRFMQTLTQIGPLVVVPFCGEPFAEIALRIRAGSPFPHTLCAGTTNGKQGYFVTREARPRGGYEVSVARCYGAHLFADNVDDVLVQENLKLLRQLQARKNH